MNRENAIKVVRRIQDAGHHALFVGGCVRDRLMGYVPHDYDIMTSMLPEQVETLFKHTTAAGKHFAVIIVDGDYEVATARIDHYKGTELTVAILDPKTHTLEELVSKDSQKRDFTCNSCYEDPLTGKIYDPVGGIQDIKDNVLRFVGDPVKRIEEDPIRMLRFYRFAFKYGMTTDDLSRLACPYKSQEIKRVSMERVYKEATKALLHVRHDYELFSDFVGVLAELFPCLDALCRTPQSPIWHPEGNVEKHTFGTLQQLRLRTDVTVWGAFLHDLGKVKSTTKDDEGRIRANGHDAVGVEMAEVLLDDLKVPNALKDAVLFIIGKHMIIKRAPEMKKAKVIKLIKHKHFETLMEVSMADDQSSVGWTDWYFWLRAFMASDKCPDESVVKPLITGGDLHANGFKHGKDGVNFKEILDKAYEIQLNNLDKEASAILVEVLDELGL